MIAASSPASFAAAVAAHVLEDVDIDTSALAGADLVLVGETHGLRETPSVLYALACALDTKAIALEWSHEEMHGPLQEFLRDGSFDFERLWRLPASAELFCGDGRITAGHFALLQRLRREGRLEQVVAFDRLDPEPLPPWQVRDREMAERLLAEWDRRLPLLAGFLLAVGLAAVRLRVLPAWLGWISLVLGVVALVPPIGWAVVVFAFPLWIVGVAAFLWRDGKVVVAT
jgi:hypothetical protein